MLLRPFCVLLAAIAIFTNSALSQTSQACQNVMGNTYCSAVKAISISNFGVPGQFNVVTNMDSKQKICDKTEQQSFNGGVAPLDEGISWHFRGPINLKQFAAYTMSAQDSKRSMKPGFQERRHGHNQYHRRGKTDKNIQEAADADNNRKRGVCGMVTATIDGKVASWTNNYLCTPATAVSAPPSESTKVRNDGAAGSGKAVTVTITVSVATTKTSTTTVSPSNGNSAASSTSPCSTSVSTTVFTTSTSTNTVTVTNSPSPSSSSSLSQGTLISQSATTSPLQNTPSSSPSTSQGSSSSSSMADVLSQSASSSQSGSSQESQTSSGNSGYPSAIAPTSGTWVRQAYYNADQQVADRLVFLSPRGGGNESGVFDTAFGASMSYASPDPNVGAPSPQCLANQMVDDGVEFAILTDQDWEESYGYKRPGTIAHKGFEGSMKLFLMEFSMPLTGKRTSPGADNNCFADCPAIWALNHRIPSTQQYGGCNCWPGCGELDVFECLNAGNDKMITTLHGINRGGQSDYFKRPTDKTMKGAVLFDGTFNSVYILVLDDNVDISTTIPSSTVDQWVSSGQNDASNFAGIKLAEAGPPGK